MAQKQSEAGKIQAMKEYQEARDAAIERIATLRAARFARDAAAASAPTKTKKQSESRRGDGNAVHLSARVFLDDAFEIGLFGNTFVRFICALDAIQPFVALGRKQLRYFIYAARSGLAAMCIPDGLADLEPMFAQMGTPRR